MPQKREITFRPDLKIQGYFASWPSHIRDKTLQRVATKRRIPHIADQEIVVINTDIKPKMNTNYELRRCQCQCQW